MDKWSQRKFPKAQINTLRLLQKVISKPLSLISISLIGELNKCKPYKLSDSVKLIMVQ